MKKKLSILLSSILVLAVASVFVFYAKHQAKTVEFEISAENASVNKNEELELVIKVTSSVALQGIDSYISYDDEILEFIGEKQGKISGASGKLHLMDEFTDGVTEASYKVTMRALQTGQTKFQISDSYMEDYQSNAFRKVKSNSATIKVVNNKKESEETRLSKLSIANGEFDKEFDPEQLEYKVKVPNDTEELILSAVPLDEKSVVSIEGNLEMHVDEKTIVVKVTALSGATREYKLLIKRELIACDVN